MTDLYEIDITRANNFIAEWGRIAQSIARQCRWRLKGQCLASCMGLAVCNLDGLTLVDAQGQPVGRASLPANAKTEEVLR